ncbi:Oxidoreductase, short-chain dehydrogenase/reductase family [hydrothermal vent metagenome]|uniref:Oxidoreductase, short-chain dehydrogenase/reductase family n=1 Tax=hydrothermal vent metagenome TaxID=652676 RepID=A0A3B0XBQ0_9ZZZZ
MQYQPADHFLKDKIILVTGAGDGLGQAAAKAYAAQGATVVLLGRTTKKLENTYDEIIHAGYPEPAIYPLNLEGASPVDYEKLADTLNEQFGSLHGLLHSAAILGTLTPIQQHDIEIWYKVMQVNLNAPFVMTQALLPLLRSTDGSKIIFTTDDKSQAYWGAYGISKDATTSFMKVLADEMDTESNPVQVNAINPGAVRTQMRVRAFPGENPDTLPCADDVMPAYLYLMSDDCKETGKTVQAQAV